MIVLNLLKCTIDKFDILTSQKNIKNNFLRNNKLYSKWNKNLKMIFFDFQKVFLKKKS